MARNFFDDNGDHLKWMHAAPEEYYDPTRNKKIVEATIRKNDALRKKKIKEFDEQLGERVEAVAHYLKALDRGDTGSPAEKYFGRKELAHLQGQKIMREVAGWYKNQPIYKLVEVS